jgi:3-oxoacyl-[acyl-carrier-protein] synthase II
MAGWKPVLGGAHEFPLSPPAAICYVAQVMSIDPSRRRVVITGMGLVSPLGSHPDGFWQHLAARDSGVVECTILPSRAAGLPLRYAGEARQFTGDIADFGDLEGDKKKSIRKGLKVMSRETQMAVAAAGLAITHAGLSSEQYNPERAGVVLGSDYMLTMPEDYIDGMRKCAPHEAFEFEKWGDEGLEQMAPLWMLKYLPNMPASHIAILNDLRGPNNSLTLREAASNMAVGEAFRTIARGHADMMLGGATGTRILPMQAIHAMQTEELATGEVDPATASRPFDAGRIGMVAGEGAGVVVLEEREAALGRGATIYGEVVGLGASTVADKNLRGDAERAFAGALRLALADAEIGPDEVGHINAHAMGTREGDRAEAAALAAVFGSRLESIPVTALKSYFGNLGAGSGAVELMGSLLAFQHGQLPAVLNYTTPDPECSVKVATGSEPPGQYAVCLSVTPQGQASVLVVKSPS